MDVGFVKLVYVRHPLWAEKSRWEVEVFSIFTGVGWWVCVCGYTRVHTHKLLGYSMGAQVWDGHLESRKNPD